jgi:LPS-assembly lipoprotein
MTTARKTNRSFALLAEAGSSARRRLVIAALAGAALAACGFQPRGVARMPFSSLHLSAATNTPFGQELRRALLAADVRLEELPAKAAVTLTILSEIREKHIRSLGGQGRVREYELRYRVAYQLTDAKTTITPATQILLKRDVSFNDNEALAKESEETTLYRDMQTDAVQQLLRRLQATKLAKT